jgi:hypothetical protein
MVYMLTWREKPFGNYRVGSRAEPIIVCDAIRTPAH